MTKTKQEEEIEGLSEKEVIFELDELITKGVDSEIPFNFIYPNTDKKVGVMVRPLATHEYQNALLRSKKLGTNFLVELCSLGVSHMDGSDFSKENLNELPAGVITLLVNEISRISGLDLAEEHAVDQTDLLGALVGF